MHKEEKKELVSAMVAAQEAFERHLVAEFDVDPAFYDLRLTGYVLSTHDFLPLDHVVFPATYKSEGLGRERGEE